MSGDVLSQNEIDELLSALTTGAVSAEEMKVEQQQRKIKTYDFKRPDKFSKDQIRTLFMLHENFARLLNTYLSAQLRAMVLVNVVSVDQLMYEEFIRSMPNPSVIGVYNMKPLRGNAIMEVNPAVAFSIIDRLFGGPGIPPAKSRALTDIEEAIMRRFFSRALESFQEAWKQVLTIDARLEGVEMNPQFTQIVPPTDMVVIVTMQAKIGTTEGLINLCIPYLVLEPIMSKLSTTFWVASSVAKQSLPEHITAIQKKLERAMIPVTVELGRVGVTVQEMLELSVGDVLQMETKVADDLLITIGSRGKFKCKPGLAGSRIAVQISEVIAGGAENNE